MIIRKIPEKLLGQLKERGIFVAPIGPRYEQSLVSIQKLKKGFKIKKQIPGFIFVKFV